ncbi:hypothetical protein [Immundisolibacter sp.]|uniref:hypothetical protein n=1 Tax=Immundisolibacter sp. TaxID=1934948 RepID=UPI003F8408E1
MRRTHLLAPLILLASFAATADNSLEREAMNAVTQGLRDPDSANFRNVETVTYTTPTGGRVPYVCGEVNAKNSFGGYVGFRRFYVANVGGELRADIEPAEREDRSVFSMMYDTFCLGIGMAVTPMRE